MSTDPCPACGAPTVVRPVPEPCRGLLETDPSTVLFCTRCLQVHPTTEHAAESDWNPSEVSGALPSDPGAAIAVGMLLTFLSSLALNRRKIEQIVVYLEEELGVDPLLALDRIQTAPLLQPQVDLDRRREQVAQVLSRD